MTVPVEIEFRLEVAPGILRVDRELTHLPVHELEHLRVEANWTGEVVLRAQGQPTLEWDDEDLDQVITGLCFESIPALATGQSHAQFCMSYPATVHLDPRGDDVLVWIEGLDDVPRVTAPRTPLLWALHSCGQRFLTGYRVLRPEREADLARLEELAAEAEAALGGAVSD